MAAAGIGRDSAIDYGDERRRQVGSRVAEPHGRALRMRATQLLDRRCAHRKRSSDQPIQQHADAIEIGTFARRRAGEDFRREI